jgi:serine/threonine-protein kinase
MKPAFKFTSLIAASLLLLNLYSCSKKETPKPANTTSAPTLVYNAYNHAAQYPTTGMTMDAAGNLYIASVGNNSISVISPSGVVTAIAGSGKVGSADGTGTAASFNLPSALALDAANNIYVADAANNLIRKITPAGVVTTIAGNGAIGSADGKGPAASFNFPQGIAVDASGIIYVSDTGNDLIRKITPDGTVTTFAGKIAAGNINAIGAAATFNIPQGLAIDAVGNLYVADAGNNLIREITPGGVVTTFAGSGQAISYDGTGTGASFDFPNSLAISASGNLYVTESYSNNVSKITPGGKVNSIDVSQVASYGIPYQPISFLANPSVLLPNGIAFDNKLGVVFIVDYGNGLIRQGSGS